jgi:hypothetical protein
MNLLPVFHNSFETLNLYRIFITIPIINLDTKKYIGIIGMFTMVEGVAGAAVYNYDKGERLTTG